MFCSVQIIFFIFIIIIILFSDIIIFGTFAKKKKQIIKNFESFKDQRLFYQSVSWV